MGDDNLEYLRERFVTLTQVALQSNLSESEIQELIESKVLPQASYVVRKSIEITSPLGDKYETVETMFYFPPNYVELVKASTNKTPHQLKDAFIWEMRKHLLSHPDKTLAYGNVFDGNSVGENRLAESLNEEWDAYNKGIYGICTLKATAEEVIEKEIAIKRLMNVLSDVSDKDPLHHKESLVQAIEEFDEIVSLFAPYQRELSSRGKYVDTTLHKLNLAEKIKTY